MKICSPFYDGRLLQLNSKYGKLMSGKKIEKKVTVGNRMGLHARPASCIATILADYPEAEVTLARPDDFENAADCHSVLSLMILAAGQGTELILSGSGEGAAEAVRRIEACFTANFDEGR